MCSALAVALIVGSGSSADARSFTTWKSAKKLKKRTYLGHTFTKVSGWSSSCMASYTVHYSAPKRLYSFKNYKRNAYSFQFVITMQSGKVVTSELRPSYNAGKKLTYSFTDDTRRGNCWSSKRQKIRSIAIYGCHGRGCKVRLPKRKARKARKRARRRR